MPLPDRLHRILLPANGIHGVIAWEVGDLGDVTDLSTADVGRVAAVGSDPQTRRYHALIAYDDFGEGYQAIWREFSWLTDVLTLDDVRGGVGLDQLQPPLNPVSLGGQVLSDVGAPLSDNDAVNSITLQTALSQFADIDTQIMTYLQSLRAADFLQLPAYAAADVPVTLHAGLPTIDGISVPASQLPLGLFAIPVLLTAQADPAENGVWIVVQPGDDLGAGDGVWLRQLVPGVPLYDDVIGASCFVSNGVAHGGSWWTYNYPGQRPGDSVPGGTWTKDGGATDTGLHTIVSWEVAALVDITGLSIADVGRVAAVGSDPLARRYHALIAYGDFGEGDEPIWRELAWVSDVITLDDVRGGVSLDQLQPPLNPVSMGGQVLGDVGAPVADGDAVNQITMTNALALKANRALTINTQSGAAFTLTANAPDEWLLMTHATASVVTVPPNSAVPIGTGMPCPVSRHGAGTLTITAGAGVTLRPSNNLTVSAQYGTVTLTKCGTDEWYVDGAVT